MSNQRRWLTLIRLSVQCVAFGEPILIDAGTGSYRRCAVAQLLGPRLTPRCVGMSTSAQPAGPFRWRSPRATCGSGIPTPSRCRGCRARRLQRPQAVTCHRRAVFVKPHYWLLLVASRAARRYTSKSRSVRSDRVTRRPHPWALPHTPGGRVFSVAAIASEPLRSNLASRELAPIRRWTSLDYGQREPAPLLTYSSTASLPWRCLTLLFPTLRRRRSPPVCPLVDDATGRGGSASRLGTSVVIDNHAGVTTIEM